MKNFEHDIKIYLEESKVLYKNIIQELEEIKEMAHYTLSEQDKQRLEQLDMQQLLKEMQKNIKNINKNIEEIKNYNKIFEEVI